MRELSVQEVRVSTSGTAPVVVLQEAEGGRLLPIWMSAGGAAAIVSATEPPDPARPCVHDLVSDLLATLASSLDQVRIVGFEDGQFFAELVLQGTVLAARPSDAIALALRAGCPILCAEEVLDEAGVRAVPEVAEAPDDEVEKFREFLDSVNPDDFEP
jgi:bifunctional DNase/RNase